MATGRKIGSYEGNNRLCRVCLAESEDNRCIFNLSEGDAGLWERLRFYGGIEVSQDDGLPERMCGDCVAKLQVAHEFRTQCQETDRTLRFVRNKGSWVLKAKEEEDLDSDIVRAKNGARSRTILVLKKVGGDRLYESKNSTLSVNESENSESFTLRESVDDVSVERTRSKEERRDSAKKDSYRSRRLSLFKRATSMTNLKNNKERQRKYLKKMLFSKHESSDRDNPQSKPAVDCKKASCDQYPDNLHSNTAEELEPICKICNKNFRKAVTMVRHLNVHKREHPRAVYSILKDIRDRRKNGEEKILQYSKFTPNQNLRPGSTSPSSSEEEERTPVPHERRSSLQSKLKHTCTSCNAKFSSPDKLQSHEELCTPREPLDSSPPDDRTAIKLINIWIKEELESDYESGKGFSCESCGKSYASSKSLLKHRSKMHSELVRCCPRCCLEDCVCLSTTTPQKPLPQIQSFTCEQCHKSFEKKSTLERHSRIHARAKEQQDSNFKRFLCHICSKTFRQNTGLMFHMRTHTGYKPHVCRYCGRGFTSNSNCINHERTHTGDRPFVCHFCSAAFAKSCTLKAHITTHTGEANYHCKTCGKSFRRLKYLKEHRFTHTGEKPYACKICGTAYSHSGSLFVHEKKCKAQDGSNLQTHDKLDYRQPVIPSIPGIPLGNPSELVVPTLNPETPKNYTDILPRMHNGSLDPSNALHLAPPEIRSFSIVGSQIFDT